MSDPHAFIGRQPILDREERVVAYELLFRNAANATTADFSEQDAAATRVMVNTFATMGERAVLGDCLGFFNVTQSLLSSDLIQALPAPRVVIEILETVEPDATTFERCRELKDLGFRIALDDYVLEDGRESMLELADIVKVDLPAMNPEELAQLVTRLRQHPVQLLAEKVETREELELCRSLGFDLYQGYFFAKPIVLEGASLDSSQVVLTQLLQRLYADCDSDQIADVLKHHVNLGVNLLRVVNSAAMAKPHKIARIEDAVTYLGRQQLQRWVTLLLFAGADGDGIESPLLQTAAHRGRLMELALGAIGEGERPDRAFLVGMLSLVDVLVSRPLDEIVRELNLDDDIEGALLKREGVLGALLLLVEETERADFDAVESRSSELGISLPQLQEVENLAYAWVHDLVCEPLAAGAPTAHASRSRPRAAT